MVSNTDVSLSFSWTKLTERFFKNTPWPEAEAIAPQVGNGKSFSFFACQREKELNTFWYMSEQVNSVATVRVSHLCSLWQLLPHMPGKKSDLNKVSFCAAFCYRGRRSTTGLWRDPVACALWLANVRFCYLFQMLFSSSSTRSCIIGTSTPKLA